MSMFFTLRCAGSRNMPEVSPLPSMWMPTADLKKPTEVRHTGRTVWKRTENRCGQSGKATMEYRPLHIENQDPCPPPQAVTRPYVFHYAVATVFCGPGQFVAHAWKIGSPKTSHTYEVASSFLLTGSPTFATASQAFAGLRSLAKGWRIRRRRNRWRL